MTVLFYGGTDIFYSAVLQFWKQGKREYAALTGKGHREIIRSKIPVLVTGEEW